MSLKYSLVAIGPKEMVGEWKDEKGVQVAYVNLFFGEGWISFGWECKAASSATYRATCTPTQLAFYKGLCPATLKHMLRDVDGKTLLGASVESDIADPIHIGGSEALMGHYVKLGFRSPTEEESIEHNFDVITTVEAYCQGITIRPEHATLFA